MTEVIVGTAGHIDHGKTALVKALTGTDADRLPEEKRRGITVDIGFAEMQVGDQHFGFVDVPGHERFVKNMLAGAIGIDIVLLVIAADDGVMPQTREHFDICRLLGVRSGVIAITKTDLVDAETLELAKLDAAELVAGSFLENAPVVAVSSVKGEGVDDLRDALAAVVVARPESSLVARLPIDRSFSMKGFGTVVTGTLASGSIGEGDEVELLPAARRVRVRGLQSHGKAASRVDPGQRVAVNLAGIDHSEITRGMMLAEPGVLRPTQMIDARVEILADAKRPVRSRQRVRLHIGTAEVLGRVRVLDIAGGIAPGAFGLVQLSLEAPVAAIPGERFIIRSYSPQVTIGGGEVVDGHAPRHRAASFAAVQAKLKALAAAATDEERLMLMIESGGKRGMATAEIRERTGWRDEAVETAIRPLILAKKIVAADGVFISTERLSEMSTAALTALETFHRRRPLDGGMPREALRERAFRGVREAIFQYSLRNLVADGKIAADGDLLRLAGFSNQLSDAEQNASEKIYSRILEAGLEVPKIDEVLGDAALAGIPQQNVRRLLQLLLDSGRIVKISDDFFFASDIIDRLVESLRRDAGSGNTIDVARFKELAGVSRKFAIPLLEYFDRSKVTVRRGDTRVVL